MATHKLIVGAVGDLVAELHTQLQSHGKRVPAAEVARTFFGPGTRQAIANFQAAHGIKATGEVCDATAAQLAVGPAAAAVISPAPPGRVSHEPTRAVQEPKALPIAPRAARPAAPPASHGDERYVVDGAVTSTGASRLRVELVDINVRDDVRLAEATTDGSGGYQVSFAAAMLQELRKEKPDLQARVYAGDTFLGASDIRYNATIRETLDVRLSEMAASALPSEHETLSAALTAHYDGVLGHLEESDEKPHITYLANKSGWDARAIAMAALSEQFSADATAANAGIHPALYYALFRAGLPADRDALYQADPQAVQQAWTRAIQEGVIPNTLQSEVPSALQAFKSLSAQRLLTAPALVGASSLKEMLTTSRLDDAQQQRFAALYTEHQADLPTFWKGVGDAFGKEVTGRLQVDGKLGVLTVNNAPLMAALHAAMDGDGVTDPLQLAQQGYYRATQWSGLLTDAVPVPKEIPGDTLEAQRANYAAYLAAQVRVSYPTAAVAHMIKSGDLPLTGAAAGVSGRVSAFLTEQQGKFEIGVQPVQQYITRNNLQVADDVLTQVKRVQRVYQIAPSDQAMTGLMKHGLDAAFHVVRHDRELFVQTYQQDLGGAESAAQTFDRSVQVHNTVLNIAVSYITAKNGIPLGAQRLEAGQTGLEVSGQVLRPVPQGLSADIIAYPTLEDLFGAMDFCTCDHCRSVLSPAAYLVDLLGLLDQPPDAAGNPQSVLFNRRPDIQHLPLTCENTNTALPYLDIVNETLEYFVADTAERPSLKGYVGHDTAGVASADLMASPQFVVEAAYDSLREARFPFPLPFHQPLENLRRYFDKFGVPLPLAMERFRQGDALERGAKSYGWRDIFMEDVGLSPEEHEILTDSGAVPLCRMYGFPAGTTDDQVINTPWFFIGTEVFPLSNARLFSRHVGITYDDIAAILQTRFVNPNSDLIPKLERLGVALATLEELKDGTITDAAFDELLPQGAAAPDPAAYGNDITGWVKDDANFARIMSLITLADPTGEADSCRFDTLEFRFAGPTADANTPTTSLGAVEFIRLLRFIRLWKKLKWTVEQTDAAICALYRTDLSPLTAADVDTVAKLDAGFLTLLPRLGIVVRVMHLLHLTATRDLLPLLACWAEIGTHGASALYRQMFLNPALLKQDAVFDDNGYGAFLTTPATLADHVEALRSAFSLTGDEYNRIVAALGYDANTPLTLPNISPIFRRGWLARTLKLSVPELLMLMQLTGLDPFAAPDPTDPAILRVIALVETLRARSLKPTTALSLIWNQDLSGTPVPDAERITELARTLRDDFAGIDDQLAATEDTGGDIVAARMALAYGRETADAFVALLENALALDVAYTHPQPTLEAAISAADPGLAYDDFRHRLSHTGLLSAATRDALKAVGSVTPAFQEAVESLFARGEDIKGSFFVRNPQLKPLYDSYVASTETVDTKRAALLAALRPELALRRKRAQALQRLTSAAGADPTFAQVLLDAPAAPYPLHASGLPAQPALDDVLAVETPGLTAQFFFRDSATGPVDVTMQTGSRLDYARDGVNQLPGNPAPGAAISGIWSGKVEAPEAGFYNFIVVVEPGAAVRLNFGKLDRPLTQNGTIWRNTDPLELKAGTLYEIVLTVEKVRETLRVKWETPKRAREVVPARYLYPPTILGPFSDTYIRFLKAAALADALQLTAGELAHFATDAGYLIAGDGWLNALPLSGEPVPAAAAGLLSPLQALLDYTRIKAAMSLADESLLRVLQALATPTATAESALFGLTRWDPASLNDLLTHFGGDLASLAHFDQFRRVNDALVLTQTMGLAASALIKALHGIRRAPGTGAETTNTPDVVRDFQAALRARYDATDWRSLVQPINDVLRGLQRDALVACILHQMRSEADTAHINTPDKLFEYFLMDVQMEPCMQTSRIRHALSSVQLFIERCLMNLELDVSPAAINSKHWEWMKRYRVWEANRKIFLWPENWLEPELRDDKSPFFKEIESELLQSDITEDTAATALLNYLAKLCEVAHLEPCGIYHVEADEGRQTGEIDHVIARTTGAGRKYYYRRRENGFWTPWEPVSLEIEDNPVIPVVWKDRLFLFWLRILKKGPDTAQKPPSNKRLVELEMSELPPLVAPTMTVQAVLCWSEYYNGKWQPTKTSDVSNPASLGQFDLTLTNRSRLLLSSFVESDDLLVVGIDAGYGVARFGLFNTHSLPVLADGLADDLVHGRAKERALSTTSDALVASYYARQDGGGFSSLTNTLLTDSIRCYTVAPSHFPNDVWIAPFFLTDSRHIFYVTTAVHPVKLFDDSRYGMVATPNQPAARIPPLLLPGAPPQESGLKLRRDDARAGAATSPMPRVVSEDAHLRLSTGIARSVIYNGKQIGSSGVIAPVRIDI